jgi:hypothetical protein
VATAALISVFYYNYLKVHVLASLFPAVFYYLYTVSAYENLKMKKNLEMQTNRDHSEEATIEWVYECFTMACTTGIFVFYYWHIGVHFLASLFVTLLFYFYAYANLEIRKKMNAL